MPRQLTRTRRSAPAEEPEETTQEARPSRRSARGGDDSASEGRSRRTRRVERDDDDSQTSEPDEDRPARGGARRGGGNSATVGKGWGAYAQQRARNSDFPDEFKPSDEITLIKILDEEPFVVYSQHWYNELNGKKSWNCLGDDCPLCDEIGDTPRVQACFNVVDMTDPANPKVKVWIAGPLIIGYLKDFSEDPMTSPINRDDLYWSVRKVIKQEGKKKKTDYKIKDVEAGELEKYFPEVGDPFSDEELEEFDGQRHDESFVRMDTAARLREVVDSLS